MPANLREYHELDALLNANENPYRSSPMALEALKKSASGGNPYAWKELFELMDKIGEDPKFQ